MHQLILFLLFSSSPWYICHFLGPLPSTERELCDSQHYETEKYGHESCGTQNQEWLPWWGPAAIYLIWPIISYWSAHGPKSWSAFPTRTIFLPLSAYSTLKTEVAGSSETLETIYKTTQHCVPEDSSFHTACCENSKCCVTRGIWRMFCTRDIGMHTLKCPTHTFPLACHFFPISFQPNNWRVWWLCPHKCSSLQAKWQTWRMCGKIWNIAFDFCAQALHCESM